MPDRSRFAATLAITSLAWFMFTLDRLVVVTALPVIRTDLDAGVAGLEWTTNAYTVPPWVTGSAAATCSPSALPCSRPGRPAQRSPHRSTS